MNNTSIYGDYNFVKDTTKKDLVLKFDSKYVYSHFQLCAKIANFVGEYLKLNDNNRHKFSYVINELIENSIKYSIDDNSCFILNKHHDNLIELETRNYCSAKQHSNLMDFCTFMWGESIAAKYSLEEKFKICINGDNSISKIGLILTVKDHNAKLGFKVKKINDDKYFVRTKCFLQN